VPNRMRARRPEEIGRTIVRPDGEARERRPGSLVQSIRMSRRDRQDRAEETEEREADDPLVQLERKLRDGKSVDVQDVRRAWRTTRYPRAMVQVLAQRRRPDLAVRAASIVGIEVDPTSPTWREDLEANLFERFFGLALRETDALADDIRRAIPDPAV
jgi:hypothetical protein